MQGKFLKFLNSDFCPVVIAGAFTGLMATAALIPKKPVTVKYREEITETQTAYIEQHSVDVTKAEPAEEERIQCRWGGFEITPEEYELICRTTYCESGNQNIDTQIMTALTILNRMVSDKFPDTVEEVIYQANQYKVTQWQDFDTYVWTESVEQAVAYALEVNEYPTDMFYFRTSHYHMFGKPYMKSDELYFSTEE